jgi:hypothetical protein
MGADAEEAADRLRRASVRQLESTRSEPLAIADPLSARAGLVTKLFG